MASPLVDRPLVFLAAKRKKKLLKSFAKRGYVVLDDVCSDEACGDFIDEVWGILEDVPRVPGMEIKRPDDPLGPLSPAWLKDQKARWVPHGQFGAPCEPPLFHMQTMWKMRQSPALYDFYAALLGSPDLWVGLNRPIVRLPGQGQSEFWHWDTDPFHWNNDGSPVTGGLHGIVAFSDITITISRVKTFTKEFTERFRRQYGYLRKASAQSKVSLQSNKPDPLGLLDPTNWTTLHVPKGALVVWSAKMLHSTSVNTSSRALYGMYLGYRSAVSRENMSNTELGLDERGDRIRSFTTGKMPFRYPSGDRTHYMPLRWANFPKVAAAYQRRLPEPQASQTRAIASGARKGTMVAAIFEPDPKNYTQPHLSALGRKLLGLDMWTNALEEEEDKGLDVDEVKHEQPRASKRAVEHVDGEVSEQVSHRKRKVAASVSVQEAGAASSATEQSRSLTVGVIQPGDSRELQADCRVYADALRNIAPQALPECTLEVVQLNSVGDTKSQSTVVSGDCKWKECDALIGMQSFGGKQLVLELRDTVMARAVTGGRQVKLIWVPSLAHTPTLAEAAAAEDSKSGDDTSKDRAQAAHVLQHLLPHLTAVVGKTDTLAERLRACLPAAHVVTVPHVHALEVPQFSEGNLRNALLHMGGESDCRNSQHTCSALQQILNQYPGLHVVCQLDSQSAAAAVPFLALEQKNPQRVEYIRGAVSEHDKLALYHTSRIAVCCSKVEAFGNYSLEAAAHGCQVVTTNGMPMSKQLVSQVALVESHKHGLQGMTTTHSVAADAIADGIRLLLYENVSYDRKKSARVRVQSQARENWRRQRDLFLHSVQAVLLPLLVTPSSLMHAN